MQSMPMTPDATVGQRHPRTRTVLAGGAALTLAFSAALAGPWAAGPAAAAGPNVVIEASFDGSLTSHPADHHIVMADPVTGESADWAADYGASENAAVTPRLSGPYGTTLTVTAVGPACAAGNEAGSAVTVRANEPGGGAEIGWVAFLHLSDVNVSVGQVVYPDTVLGTVGGYQDGWQASSCWDGTHVHVEGFNRSQYSCYYAPTTVTTGTPIGRIGGSDIGGQRTACP